MPRKMDPATQQQEMTNLLALVADVREQLNNLRLDFLSHDHGATYGTFETRVTTVTNTISAGTPAASAITAVVPGEFLEDHQIG